MIKFIKALFSKSAANPRTQVAGKGVVMQNESDFVVVKLIHVGGTNFKIDAEDKSSDVGFSKDCFGEHKAIEQFQKTCMEMKATKSISL